MKPAQKTPLKDFTTRDLIVARFDESLDAAYATLMSARIRHLPVVNENDELIGIISDRDFYRAMLAEPAIFEPTDRVEDYMSWPVATIEESKSVADAARILIDRKISALVVTRERSAVGILTTEDLLRVFLTQNDSTVGRLKSEAEAALMTSSVGPLAQTLANAGL